MTIIALNHVNILSTEPVKSVLFYTKLGFVVGHRPEGFPDDGTWMYLDSVEAMRRVPLVHINHISKRQRASLRKGPIAHIGFSITGPMEATIKTLDSMGVDYKWDVDLWGHTIPGANRALYFKGPSNEMIEYVFISHFVPEATLADRVDAGTATDTELAEIAEEQHADGSRTVNEDGWGN